MRQLEDHNAAGVVGATAHHFTIPDCIYRRSNRGELLYTEDVFVALHPDESNLDKKITADLSYGLLPDDVIVSPLAVGGHLDHVLTRTAAEQLGRSIHYYADIPYLLNHPEALEPTTTGMTATLFPVSKEGLHWWKEGVAAYSSQILMLFETEEKMREIIYGYWESNRGIHLWCAA